MRQKIGFVIGVFLIFAIIVTTIDDGTYEVSDFGSILLQWGDEQEDVSDRFTVEVTAPLEGEIVGEHEVNGANWSIPNIIRHWLGVD